MAESKYTKALADEICEKIATSSKGLHSIVKENPHFPSFGTIFRWLSEPDKKYFHDNYARAREAQAEMMRDEILSISDETSRDTVIVSNGDSSYEKPNTEWISRSKLRVDTRKWLMSKLLPKVYGDKMEVSSDKELIIKVVDDGDNGK